MSRSRRKTPIFGHTSARSEADDKRLWHKRWRSRERDQLATLGPEGDPLPVHRQAVSSTWVRIPLMADSDSKLIADSVPDDVGHPAPVS